MPPVATLTREYYFSPCLAFIIGNHSVSRQSAEDTLVLKTLSLILKDKLTPFPCNDFYHLKGKGAKRCVKEIKNEVNNYNFVCRFVCRSDVDSYYATINHKVIMNQLKKFIDETLVIELMARMFAKLDDVNAE